VTRTILVIDDNKATRKIVRVALERHRWRVLDAETGQQGLDLIVKHRPDVILQDIVLPDKDGFDLVGEIRALPEAADATIIAFSGLLTPEDEARIALGGFDDIIAKPIEPGRLSQMLDVHVPLRGINERRFGEGKTVVIVDDDLAQLKLTRLRLQRVGFQTHCLSNALELFALLESSHVDAIVADVMMPLLDGFSLAVKVRQHPTLANLPVLLVTSRYVDPADRELALRAGANDLVLRAPSVDEVADALESILSAPGTRNLSLAKGPVESFERDRTARVMGQLERQVALNNGIAQRNTSLSAEISVLSSVSDAIVKGRNLNEVLDEVIASSFDAGAVVSGALYLLNEGRIESRVVGDRDNVFSSAFAHPSELADLLREQRAVTLYRDAASPAITKVFDAFGAASILVVPLLQGGQLLGAMLMVGRELSRPDWLNFAQGVANQLSIAIGLVRAVEEQQRSERLAREKERLMRTVLDSLSEGVIVANMSSNSMEWNAAAKRLAPDLRIDAQMKSLPLLNEDGTELAPERTPLARALQGETVVDETYGSVRAERADESTWLTISATPLVAASGERTGAVVVFRDVTQKRKSEAQLIASERMASVGLLAAGVAHEINNPLAAMIANLELALDQINDLNDPLREDLVAELSDARIAAERVRVIVRDMKLFSRRDDAPAGAVDAHRMLESTLRMAWNEIRHRARIVKKFDPVPMVVGVESKLAQVFLNLLVNAAQAIPAGAAEQNEIAIETTLVGDRVEISVKDSGPGIPPSVMRRLFTPFFTTKPVGTGTGLGLSICHRIISNFGGDITVQSEPGKGARFCVSLPAAKVATHNASESEDVIVPDRPNRRGRVLVVDDEPMIGTVLRRTLKNDHDVFAVSSASDALGLLREGERYDIIFCDLMMPQISGVEFYETVSSEFDGMNARIVFLSGGAFTDDAKRFLEQIPNARVEKPFEASTIRELVNGCFQVFE
jgi:PAS domain S-box-containing protein